MAELSEQKQQARQMWSGGDYTAASEMILSAGRIAAERGEVGAGDAVLDVACGSGNATIPAAQAGAKVTGLDLVPKLLEEGGERAAAAGVEVEWVEGDAEQLPFGNGSFDVVLSVFGCMFAPDQARAAAEIARVMKPGGRMAICSWTPEGGIGKFIALTSKQMPPPPEGFQSPLLWGSQDHVRGLFEETGVDLCFDEEAVVFEAESTEAFLKDYETKLPPMVAAKAALEAEGRYEQFRREMLELEESLNISEDGGYKALGEYLVATGTKSG